MPVPAYEQLIALLLRYLVEHLDGVRTAAVHEAVANAIGLTNEDRAERIHHGVSALQELVT